MGIVGIVRVREQVRAVVRMWLERVQRGGSVRMITIITGVIRQ